MIYKPFFKGIVDFMHSGPIVGVVWYTNSVIKMGRTMLDDIYPLASAPGTLHGDLILLQVVIFVMDQIQLDLQNVKSNFGFPST